MKIPKKIREIGLACLVGAASLIPTQAKAISGSISYVASEHATGTETEAGSYPELQLFYQLPGEVKGFTFLDFYKKNGYFGKTSLDREIKYNLGPKIQMPHDNSPLSQVGFGLNAIVPKMPKGIFAQAYFMPFFMDNVGEEVKNKKIAGYYVSVDLPLELKLSSFGEFNTQKKQWSYGEIELGREFVIKDHGKVGISYNPALNNDNRVAPQLEHRVRVKIPFGGK